MQRLGKNVGRYHGESIDISKILAEVEILSTNSGWTKSIHGDKESFELAVYFRQGLHARRTVYISAGIHGDEPSGPCAIMQLLAENRWPEEINIWLCPCLNPTGFPLNTRENAAGIDLNRDYRHLHTEEVKTHVSWLGQIPNFDLALCLHEDWEAHGFYVYEVNPENKPSLAPAIISAVNEVSPIDHSETIDNWPAREGVIRPGIPPEQREQWPESLYLVTHKTYLAYTLETPSDFPLALRQRAHVTAVNAALAEFVRLN